MKQPLLELLSRIPGIAPPAPLDPFVDRRGKLRHLEAVDLSGLSVTARAAVIRLSQANHSDDYGAFPASFGGLPSLHGIQGKHLAAAKRQMLKGGILFEHPGGRAFDLKGAAAYKPDYNRLRNEEKFVRRKQRADRQAANRIKRSKIKTAELSHLDDPEGGGDPQFYEYKFLSAGGNLRPLHSETFMTAFVPRPAPIGRKTKADSSKLERLVYPLPAKIPASELRMYPSFDVYDRLTPLQTCIRFRLEQRANDYGQVKVDVDDLVRWLGRVNVFKAGGRRAIEQAIEQMGVPEIPYGHAEEDPRPHLELSTRGGFLWAFIRDSAQLQMKGKLHGRGMAKVHEAKDYHNSSRRYLEFYQQVAAGRQAFERVRHHSTVGGVKCTVIYVSTETATEEWLEKEYHAKVREAKELGYSDMDICQSGVRKMRDGIYHLHLDPAAVFLHAVTSGQDLATVNRVYNTDPPGCDGTDDRNNRQTILRFIFGGKLPGEYLSARNKEAGINAGNLRFENLTDPVIGRSLAGLAEDRERLANELAELAAQRRDLAEERRQLAAERSKVLHRDDTAFETAISSMRQQAQLNEELRARLAEYERRDHQLREEDAMYARASGVLVPFVRPADDPIEELAESGD